jgi:hypothetical protein
MVISGMEKTKHADKDMQPWNFGTDLGDVDEYVD